MSFGEKVVDPGRLQAHGRVKRLLSLLSQNDKLRALMMRVGFKRDEPLLVQIINDPLHVLAIGSHVAGEPGNWLWMLGRRFLLSSEIGPTACIPPRQP